MAETTIFVCALSACATVPFPSPETLLNDEQVIDLMKSPKKWDNHVVTIKIYPYDNGFKKSYAVCFEVCDAAYADKSPFLIYTEENRFKGSRGDQPVIVTARYSSACFYKSTLCPDTRFGQFTELNRN